jgi:hypothetical protein
MECLSLWPTHIGKKGRTLGKTYGIKARCYWEQPQGTHWEPRKHIGNLKGTKEKRKRFSLPTKNKLETNLNMFSPFPRKDGWICTFSYIFLFYFKSSTSSSQANFQYILNQFASHFLSFKIHY